eukprot:TRINITY_DN2476_c0_g1_i1.p1 TRINITY_DN2476_c0_g1~~TRINITY_DN2476_c0_g1_i1.p1  ORF type:complete len:150 (-),score=18.03 TRINITY_DN2476_c0_g1_i1:43-492(-)
MLGPPNKRVNATAIKDAIAYYLPGTSNVGTWIIAGYVENNNIDVVAVGQNGVDEMVSYLSDDEIQFILVRCPYKKDRTTEETIKDVYICWCGPNVKRMEKAKKKGADGEYMKGVFIPHHAALEAEHKRNFTLMTVLDRASALSGSHIID